MSYGLTDVPATFQRLMQIVVMGLNPQDGHDCVSVNQKLSMPWHGPYLLLFNHWEDNLGKLEPEASSVHEEVNCNRDQHKPVQLAKKDQETATVPNMILIGGSDLPLEVELH